MKVQIDIWNDWSIVVPDCEFTVASIVEMRNSLELLEKRDCLKIALDLEKVNYLDSSAIGLMMNLYKRIKIRNGKFCVFGVKNDTKSILEMVNFDKTVPTYTTREKFEKEQGS